jgi:3',5'-nucleoside bisphosphate phosphatase
MSILTTFETNQAATKNLIPVDLHCHSTYSDGAFSVIDLLNMAKANGGKYIALTDHDTVAGIAAARTYAKEIGLNFIAGVEISVTWNSSLVHIIGLNINENDTTFVHNLQQLQNGRITRGEKIAAKLAKLGIPNAFAGAMQYCSNPKAISRTHFIRFLMANGYAQTTTKAFDKYLAPGKPAYVAHEWANLEDAVNWITNSGGVAVIAHPCRYKFTRTKLLKLITDFKNYGGLGIEVVSSSHSLDDALRMAHLAQECDLLASIGSDFHNTTNNFTRSCVGINHPLPDNCTPIYTKLGIAF